MTKQSAKTSNFDKSKALSLKTRNADDPAYVAYAIHNGIPFSRDLTPHERIALAVASCKPRYLVTITSQLPRDELMRAFRALKSRRRRDRRGPWVYVGTCVKSATGSADYHLHLLVWDFPYIPAMNTDLAELGAGWAESEPIKPSEGIDELANTLRVTSYVLGQHESVFGLNNHVENLPRPAGARAYLLPQRETLRERKPELLLALDRAKDPTVPDDEVC